MSMNITETSNQAAEIRHLTDTELDNVNGGFLFAFLACSTLFLSGVSLGATYHDYVYAGDEE